MDWSALESKCVKSALEKVLKSKYLLAISPLQEKILLAKKFARQNNNMENDKISTQLLHMCYVP